MAGFKGFRSADVPFSEEKTKADIARIGDPNAGIYFTGETYHARAGSLRTNALRTITEVGEVVPMNEWLLRVARKGYDLGVSKGGLGLHQIAKPTVYLYLKRREDGWYTAKKIQQPSGVFGGATIAEGTKVLHLDGTHVSAAPASSRKAKKIAPPAEPIQLQAAGNKPARQLRKAAKK